MLSKNTLAPQSRWTLSENGELFFAFILAFILNAAIRMIEYGPWQADAYFIGPEPLMATHDAYAWLAGAKGVGSYVNAHFTGIIRWLHRLTGLELGEIGFWLPVLTVPWLALPACWMARMLRASEAGVIFSLMAGSSLGFLVRTRLGFCDTDLVTLFFPLAFTCALAVWLTTQTRPGWRAAPDEKLPEQRQAPRLALLAGTLGALNTAFYSGSGSLLLAVLGMAVVIAFLLAPKVQRLHVWAELLVIYALAFGDWPGWLVGAGLCALLLLRPKLLERKEASLLLAITTVLVMLLSGLPEMIAVYLRLIATYAKIHEVEITTNASILQLPAIAQSVREAQNLPWDQVAERIAGSILFFAIGLTGFAFAVFRRPPLLLFLPFLGLGLASVQLGNRFAMYGGVALGAGLGFGLAELMRILRQSQGRRWIAQLTLACFAFWPAGDLMRNMVPTPVLPKVYAQTFLDLREKTEANARLWQWWDYGYAGQYYAERHTFGDGGAHAGDILYPLAKVHSTPSPLQAAQVIKFVTMSQRDNATDKNPASYYWTDPTTALQNMGPKNATDFVADLALAEQDFPTDIPPQYLVLSWENLRLASWISYYGNWNLISASSEPGKIQQMQGQISVDLANGALLVNGQSLPIDSLDVIEESGTRHFDCSRGANVHALINKFSNQIFVMDTKMYSSMMIQMLIADARSFAPYFELVQDRYPWTRVYKVK